MQVHWQVKPAEIHDRDDLIALWQRFMQEQNEAEIALALEPTLPTEQVWTTRLDQQIQQGKITVICRDDTVVGFVGMIDNEDKAWVPLSIAYVVDIYMVPHARSFAAFRQLITGFIDQLNGRYTQVWTNIAADKHRVGALLSRLGFTALKDFHVPDMEDQCYLMKQIREMPTYANGSGGSSGGGSGGGGMPGFVITGRMR